MEELFFNFAEHIEHMISNKLGRKIKEYLRDKLTEETSPEEYNIIENDIKNIMSNYFQYANDKDYFEIATNLFNSYVENDDENLIKSVKYFIRIYTYFQNIKMKKKLYQWRINTLYRKMGAQAKRQKSQSKINSQKNIYNNINLNMRKPESDSILKKNNN